MSVSQLGSKRTKKIYTGIPQHRQAHTEITALHNHGNEGNCVPLTVPVDYKDVRSWKVYIACLHETKNYRNPIILNGDPRWEILRCEQ